MSEPWCDFNDMPKAGCAHCRPPKPLPTAAHVMEAQYPGTCSECHRPIAVGDDIGAVAGDWLCRRCFR